MKGRTGIGRARHFPRAKSPKKRSGADRADLIEANDRVVVETQWMATAET